MSGSTRKICLLGDFGVGKTSLVSRFVRQTFSDRYLTTVGVKVDTKDVALDAARSVKLVIWDIAGGSEATPSHRAYLRGAAGALMVVDGTRAPTLDAALRLLGPLRDMAGDIPWLGLVNKSDLAAQWELASDPASRAGEEWHRVSALSGEGVEAAFRRLAARIEDGA